MDDKKKTVEIEEPRGVKNGMTFKAFLSKWGDQPRNLDKTILMWDIKTNKINILKTKEEWVKRLKEFFNETEKK